MKLKRFYNLLRIYRSYRKGQKELAFAPLRLWLEPTNRCNLRCLMCPNSTDYEAIARGDMDWGIFKKIVDEAEFFIDDINLFHRGEPLLHPEIVKMISYIHRKEIPVRIHTNATLLEKNLSLALINAGLDYISISFDGYEKNTYEKIRRGASFEKVLENIVNLLKIKKEKNLKKPFVVLQLMDFSVDSSFQKKKIKKEFLSNFRDLPLDRFTIREPHNWAGLRGKIGVKKKYTPCLFPYYSLTVLFDGTVLPCPQDFYGKLFLRSARENSLLKIWNDSTIQALRENLRNQKIPHPAPCNTCDVPYRKNFFGLTSGYLKTFLIDRLKILK